MNHVAVGLLAARCSEIGATLVHVSTDYVFSGKGDPAVPRGRPRGPVNAYGRGKLAGERRAFEEGDEVLVVRTSWVFGTGGVNFVDTILKRVEAGARELSVVDDQVGRPTFAGDLAAAIRALVERRVTGIVHFTNAGDATWFELASEALAPRGARRTSSVQARSRRRSSRARRAGRGGPSSTRRSTSASRRSRRGPGARPSPPTSRSGAPSSPPTPFA